MRCMVVLLTAAACFGQGIANVAQTGTIVPPQATFASPPSSPATGAEWTFTDASAAGVCTGGGSALAKCRYSGSGWQAVSGSGGSAFAGSTATNPAFSATPTFSLADVSTKSPTRIEPGALTANVTSVTFINKTAGAKFSIAWLQDGTGGRTVAYGASATGTCVVDPTLNTTTTQFFEVGANGTTVNGVDCVTNGVGNIPQKFFVTAAPGSIAGNLPGDFATDTTNHHEYVCNAPSGTAAPACTSVTAAGWLQVDGGGGSVTVVASGTSALGTGAISANTCATAVTATATGATTTDRISWTPNADISGVTGYGKASTDGLIIYPYPTAGNVNFKVCNAAGTSITPGAVTLNWAVVR
jgi:hypothetical protein